MKSAFQQLFYQKSAKKKLISIVVGAVTGIVNGMFGGGGGMLVVPLLTKMLKLKPKSAHATAILIILPISVVSAIFYSAFGTVDLCVVIPVGIGVMTGGIIGAKFLGKISTDLLFYLFYSLMLFAGIKMLV